MSRHIITIAKARLTAGIANRQRFWLRDRERTAAARTMPMGSVEVQIAVAAAYRQINLYSFAFM